MSNFNSSITAFFGGDTSGLEKAVLRAETTVGAFQSALGKIGITIGAAAVIGFFKSVTDKAGQINDLSDSLGASTDAIQSFGYAVRLAGGKTEDAGRAMQVIRNKVDELAEGNEKTAETFAKLGLAQKDLIGIPLEQAMERIARGYVNNQDKAGAYAALVDIVGNRSAKLTGVLEEMGRNGFGSMEAAAKSAGQVIAEDTIKKLDELGDRVETLKGKAAVVGSAVLSVVDKFAQGLGAMAAFAVNTFEGIQTVPVTIEAAGNRAVKAVTTATEAIKGQMATAKDFAAFQEAEAKRELARLDMAGDRQGKINFLLDQAEKYMAAAAGHQHNSKEQLELIGKANESILASQKEMQARENEIAEAREKAANKHIASMDKLEKLQFDRLSSEEKMQKLAAGLEEIRRNIVSMEAKGIDTTDAKIALMETENALAAERAKLEKVVTAQLEEQVAQKQKFVAFERSGKETRELSDIQLGAASARLQKQLAGFRVEDMETGMGFLGGANYKSPLTLGAEAELRGIKIEQEMRQKFKSTVGRGGMELAESTFAPSTFDRMTALYGNNPEKILQQLNDIGGLLRGVFKK